MPAFLRLIALVLIPCLVLGDFPSVPPPQPSSVTSPILCREQALTNGLVFFHHPRSRLAAVAVIALLAGLSSNLLEPLRRRLRRSGLLYALRAHLSQATLLGLSVTFLSEPLELLLLTIAIGAAAWLVLRLVKGTSPFWKNALMGGGVFYLISRNIQMAFPSDTWASWIAPVVYTGVATWFVRRGWEKRKGFRLGFGVGQLVLTWMLFAGKNNRLDIFFLYGAGWVFSSWLAQFHLWVDRANEWLAPPTDFSPADVSAAG